jgi:hypothetical protein
MQGVAVDHDTRRQKQQALMTELLERKIRLHARHLYDQRGQAEGEALKDWVEAESQVLENSTLAPLYRKNRTTNASPEEIEGTNPPVGADDSCTSGATS